jgi:hypothetical protein
MHGADSDTRIVRQQDLEPTLFAERIALFALVNRHPRAASVLSGLAGVAGSAAKRLLETAAAWPSSKRQARATLEFGHRGDQHERLGKLVLEAHPLLRLAMCAQMTPQQQSRFPQLANREFRQLPARNAFAARLVREASR